MQLVNLTGGRCVQILANICELRCQSLRFRGSGGIVFPDAFLSVILCNLRQFITPFLSWENILFNLNNILYERAKKCNQLQNFTYILTRVVDTKYMYH